MIRVLIADDQAMVRAGFAALLNANDDIEVVGEAADGEQAVARAGELQPDVILMDVRMPRLDG
ncbi:MAG TPA: response regulator, partial [Pseudolysinimonas sp.]|nr:response regulator [Pseudolysinimonas sp.]